MYSVRFGNNSKVCYVVQIRLQVFYINFSSEGEYICQGYVESNRKFSSLIEIMILFFFRVCGSVIY